MADAGDRGQPVRLPWWPKEHGASREPLRQGQIVATAIKLIDAEGLDGLSMRRLGQELGVGPMSIYGHVRNKDELIDLVLDEIAADVRLDDDTSAPWRSRVASVAREIRAMLRRHRHLAPLAGTRISMGPNSLLIIEHLMSIVREAGFEGTRLTFAFAAIMNFAIGTTIMDVRGLTGPATKGKTDEELQAAVFGMYAALPGDQFPNLVRFIPETDFEGVEEDAQFEYALQLILDGLEVDLART